MGARGEVKGAKELGHGRLLGAMRMQAWTCNSRSLPPARRIAGVRYPLPPGRSHLRTMIPKQVQAKPSTDTFR